MSDRASHNPGTPAALVAVSLALALGGGACLPQGHFEFEHPWVLAIAVVVTAVVAFVVFRRPVPPAVYSRTDLLNGLPMSARTALRRSPEVMRVLAVAMALAALARPQWEDFDERTVEGTDIFVVLDMSGSMLAVDMTAQEIYDYQTRNREEPPNRFANAKRTLMKFVEGRQRDRIGMVVFAREAYLQFPLTLDYATILTLLDRLQIQAIDASATAIGNALGLSIRGLVNSEARSRSIILITDGKQQGGNISPVQAAELAKSQGIAIYTILVGQEGAAMAPVNLRTPNGFLAYQPQAYQVDPELLQQIAELTGGRSYRATQPEELERELNAILDELEKTRLNDIASVRERELFAIPAFLAVLLLCAEFGLTFVLLRRFP